MRRLHRSLPLAALALLLAAPAAAALPAPELPIDQHVPAPGSASTAQTGGGSALVGTFGIDEGRCAADGTVEAGSWFQMLDPSGRPVANGGSPCPGSGNFTPLRPGTDGGLVTGDYQPHPDPAFDGGHGANDRITQPQEFFGWRFSTATNQEDPQTGTAVAAPSVTHDGSGGLTGDVRAFAAAWNGQHFNQGAPKPDGSTPGRTEAVAGTYDPATGAYSLTWQSLIQGGPFNNFTGIWHLEGTFSPSGAPAGGGTPEGGSGDGGTGDTAAPGTGGTGGTGGASTAGGPATGGTGGPAAQATGTGGALADTGGGPATLGLLALAFGAVLVLARRRLAAVPPAAPATAPAHRS